MYNFWWWRRLYRTLSLMWVHFGFCMTVETLACCNFKYYRDFDEMWSCRKQKSILRPFSDQLIMIYLMIGSISSHGVQVCFEQSIVWMLLDPCTQVLIHKHRLWWKRGLCANINGSSSNWTKYSLDALRSLHSGSDAHTHPWWKRIFILCVNINGSSSNWTQFSLAGLDRSWHAVQHQREKRGRDIISRFCGSDDYHDQLNSFV